MIIRWAGKLPEEVEDTGRAIWQGLRWQPDNQQDDKDALHHGVRDDDDVDDDEVHDDDDVNEAHDDGGTDQPNWDKMESKDDIYSRVPMTQGSKHL